MRDIDELCALSLSRMKTEKAQSQRLGFSVGGDGRTRTAVQTNHPKAFYTLILSLIVGNELPGGRLLKTYPLFLKTP